MQISWQTRHFRVVEYRLRGKRGTFARSGTDFVASAVLSQGQVQISWQAQFFVTKCTILPAAAPKIAKGLSQGWANISWQAQYFRKVKHRFRGKRSTFARLRGRRSTFARLGIDSVAGAILSQSQVQISWQAQFSVIEGTIPLFQLQLQIEKIKNKSSFRRTLFQLQLAIAQGLSQGWQTCRGRRDTFARSSTDFAAGAALSQGWVQFSWQARYTRQVKDRFRGRRSTFARLGTDSVAGAILSQGQAQILWQAQFFVIEGAIPLSKSSKIKHTSSIPSALFQLQLENRKRTFSRLGKDFVAGDTFARSSTDFVAGSGLSQGQVQTSWQAQHFRKAGYTFRGRRDTFTRSRTGAALSQGQVQIWWQAQHLRKAGKHFVAGATHSQGQVQISWQAQHFVIEGTIPLFQLQLQNRKITYKS